MPSPYDQICFSGGGLRCFWQGGFLDVARDDIELEPERIIGVSGGAMTAAGFVSRKGPQVLQAMLEEFAKVDSNINWNEPMGEEGITPHQQLYRRVIEDVMTGEGEKAVADGPPFEILLTHPPSDKAEMITGILSTMAYQAELALGRGPHFDWTEKLGGEAKRVDARQAARDGLLVDLICAAATIPPVFKPPLWDGRPVVDGGMCDQAPMTDPDEGRTLVLLTRTDYGGIPDMPDRHYVMPSEEVPAEKIDFTDPTKIQGSWDCGEADGRAFVRDEKWKRH